MLVGSFEVLQNISFAAMIIPWAGGVSFLLFRLHTKGHAYLLRFSPVEGFPLNMYDALAPRGVREASRRALGQTPADPELERMRRELWRIRRSLLIWIWGVPLSTCALAALVVATGLVRFR